MPLPERSYGHVNTSRSPTAVASVEQFLRATSGGESCRKSPTYSPTSSSPSSPYFERLKNHNSEEDNGLCQKKSVLTKVKERAMKFRYSLSKRRMEDENVTPSWGVSLEDDEEEEEDPEYLGAPMYESELAPEGYKENARQHPRANPVISEKHVLHHTVKLGVEQDSKKSRGPVNARFTTTTQPVTTTSNMTSENIAEKLAPVYAGGSNAANAISSKILASGSTTAPATNMSSQTSLVPSSSMQNSSASLCEKNTCQKSASLRDHFMNQSEKGDGARNVSTMQKSSSLSASMSGNKNITSLKSASVKDYSMNKSEPREDAKTDVSQPQMISKATSPTRTSSNAGVMDKVRGAVNSLFGNEEPSQQYGVKTSTTRTSSQTQQVDQEENRGRILQAN